MRDTDLMYEGRLRSAAGLDAQQIAAPPSWIGSGVRWHPVDHLGNRSASTEEADAVERIVNELLAGTWTTASGEERQITLKDILVVAPYNAHVNRLLSRLPHARVGTVDKFQGQEAAVVIYSMASSSAEASPRGISFLYDMNRLNVAISRARCMAIVVASPALLDAPVRDPKQLRAVNGLLKTLAATDATPSA